VEEGPHKWISLKHEKACGIGKYLKQLCPFSWFVKFGFERVQRLTYFFLLLSGKSFSHLLDGLL